MYLVVSFRFFIFFLFFLQSLFFYFPFSFLFSSFFRSYSGVIHVPMVLDGGWHAKYIQGFGEIGGNGREDMPLAGCDEHLSLFYQS